MIAKKNHSIRYLTRQDIAEIHADLSEQVLSAGSEPLPDFRGAIDALIAAPQQRFYGRDAYPTLAEKAAILFYMVNRRHIFPNGNKRLSTLCLLTFLIGNDAQLDVSPQELTEKALWLATADADDFPAIKGSPCVVDRGSFDRCCGQ